METELANLTHWINGKHVEGTSGRFGNVYNPTTGEVAAQVPLASTTELNASVEAAKAAFPEWAATPPLTRARIMFKYKAVIEDNSDRLAAVITAANAFAWESPVRLPIFNGGCVLLLELI